MSLPVKWKNGKSKILTQNRKGAKKLLELEDFPVLTLRLCAFA